MGDALGRACARSLSLAFARQLPLGGSLEITANGSRFVRDSAARARRGFAVRLRYAPLRMTRTGEAERGGFASVICTALRCVIFAPRASDMRFHRVICRAPRGVRVTTHHIIASPCGGGGALKRDGEGCQDKGTNHGGAVDGIAAGASPRPTLWGKRRRRDGNGSSRRRPAL